MYESKELLHNRYLREKFVSKFVTEVIHNDYRLSIRKKINGYVWNIYVDNERVLTADVRQLSKNDYRYSHCTDVGIFTYKEKSLIKCLQLLDEHIKTYLNLLKK